MGNAWSKMHSNVINQFFNYFNSIRRYIMQIIKKVLLALVATFGISGVCQALVMLDFDSVATGSDIIINPLVTADGTITASSSGGSLYLTSGSSGGMTGDVLRFDESVDSEYAQLAFDYDVSAIDFLFAGFISGSFTGQALDAGFNLVDSFFDGNTDNDLPGSASLSGSGIRYFRFFDGPDGLSFAGVDDVFITATAVPEPPALALMALGIIGIGLSRRKNS